MNVEIIALCDAATESQGKLNILGAFDHIWAHQVPVIQPLCAIALRIRFSRIEEGTHRLRLDLVDEDGQLVIPSLDGNISVHAGSDDGSIVANVILNLQQLKLTSFGQYSIELAVDGRQEASIPLHVKPAPEKAPPGPKAGEAGQ
jgi:hypothetical protein